MNVISFTTAHLLSAFGYEFLTFVMTVHVYDLTRQAVDVGIFMALSFVPRLLSPFYGSLTDRYPRRLLFFAACLTTAAAVAMLARQTTLAGLYVGWFAVSILAMIILNLRTAIMTQVMPEGNFLRGNAVMLVSLNLARLAAPTVGGIVATWWSAAGVLSLAAAVYAAAAVAGLATRLPHREADRTALSGVLAHLREGLTLIWTKADLALLGRIAFVWRLCLGFQGALLVVYVAQCLGKGPLEFGVLTTALAVGSVLGSAVGPTLTRLVAPRTVLVAGLGLHVVLIAALGLISDYAVALADGVAANVALYAAAVAVHSVRDTATPTNFRGRVYGSITAITAPPALVSMLLGGWLADVVGVRAVFIGGGVLALAGSLVVIALSPAFRRSACERPVPAPVGRGTND